jgi:hypothetical protein
MGNTVLTANTKTAAACVILCTALLSKPMLFYREMNEREIDIDSRTVLPEYEFSTFSDPDVAVRAKFRQLRREWAMQRGAMSSITEMSMLAPYQNIIALGLPVLPLIIAELKAEGDDPDQWFWALQTIAEANDLIPPQIGPQDQGNFRRMADAWLRWSEAQNGGYAG